ncbi:hypothetical protein [Corynebacterium sp.]|uniref:hypothetical protein n=1 Tax=Corynebacterium sp. TaxID=1720 RepID=UPI000557445C|nr:hypothetical protein [Corynebacterium sp.]
MARRFLSFFSVVGMLLGMSRAVDLLTPQQLQLVAGIYFALLVALQAWPLFTTQRGNYGHRRHPVNRMYTWLGSIGLAGTLLLALVFYAYSSIWLITLAGSLMFTGIVGAGVLAFFATPWNDWSTRRGFADEEDPYAREDEPVKDVWDNSFSA